jgi:hypothetical protein
VLLRCYRWSLRRPAGRLACRACRPSKAKANQPNQIQASERRPKRWRSGSWGGPDATTRRKVPVYANCSRPASSSNLISVLKNSQNQGPPPYHARWTGRWCIGFSFAWRIMMLCFPHEHGRSATNKIGWHVASPLPPLRRSGHNADLCGGNTPTWIGELEPAYPPTGIRTGDNRISCVLSYDSNSHPSTCAVLRCIIF